MPIRLRIATFNLMSLDDRKDRLPSLEDRIPVLRPQLVRLDADILCLQEVCGQHDRGRKRRLEAMNRLLECTPYEGYKRVSTIDPNTREAFEHHNLVILSRYDILHHDQYLHEYAPAPRYKKVTAIPEEGEAREISWERPILHARVRLPNNMVVDVINLHLKSRRPTNIQGHKLNDRTWKTASGWAEGVFISSMKRIGQALETRILIDQLFERDPCALIAVCGDFNEEFDEEAIEAIRGDVENTGNMDLSMRVMVPTERNIPEPARYSLLHNGKGKMLDHILVSRTMLAYFKGSEVHNELLHDESIVFAPKIFYPESDHAPVIARFEMPDTKLKWPTEAEVGAEGTAERTVKGTEEGAGILAGKGYQCIRNGKGRCR